MQFDLRAPLTLKFMGLGRTFREAERITGFIVTSVVMVLTIMGYRIRFSDNENPEKKTDLPYDIPGIHTGITGSYCCEFEKSAVDARGAFRSF
jgi:hypothetical protein